LLHYVRAGAQVLMRGLKPYRREVKCTLRRGKYALRGIRTNAEVPFREASFTSRAPLVEMGTRPYYGKFFKICPDVVCNDGYLGVYFYNFSSTPQVLFNLFNLWRGRHHLINHHWAKKGLPLIERFEVREAEFTFPWRFKAHIDGDSIEPKENANGFSLSVSIVPRALKFLVPQSFYVKFHPAIIESDYSALH
jgi:diacylglycerol kinase family enzyme